MIIEIFDPAGGLEVYDVGREFLQAGGMYNGF